MTRLYVVTNEITGIKHLVKATSQAQAIARLARELLSVSLPRPIEVAELLAAGAPLLDTEKEVA